MFPQILHSFLMRYFCIFIIQKERFEKSPYKVALVQKFCNKKFLIYFNFVVSENVVTGTGRGVLKE